MKLSAFVAAAAVFGTSFIAVNPAEARNGWQYITSTNGGSKVYIRDVKCRGPICEFKEIWEGGNSNEGLKVEQINCNSWSRRWKPTDPKRIFSGRQAIMDQNDGWLGGWKVMGPSSVSSSIAERICS